MGDLAGHIRIKPSLNIYASQLFGFGLGLGSELLAFPRPIGGFRIGL